MTAIYDSHLLCPAEYILRKFHQEETLAIRIEDVCQALSLIFEEVANAGVGHQVEVLVVAHLIAVLKTNALLDTPVLITNKETLLLMFIVAAVCQDKLMQFRELGITIDKYLADKVVFLLAEEC